ncbi:hypothetical protein B7C51_02010 [Paenibacillus larvae subsp. pulvifaciens]|uniref:AB hydrolase-1 domain-containing protein n=1 Tax=Paenibacillus larvae subsp. pulvifaciens TaxID=1477 RepID=A0A1V0UP00_9BACL|nr:alpha/beta fold hydrolase [Paenibacillus larvae]ARF66847.1 hypothetical protein B7C51_02010 [Paenibacillus larvae subsp. pulvifaciens]
MEQPPALLIHGFTGGTFELEPLSELLDERGIQAHLPEMPWSGERLVKRNKESWEDWLSEVTSYTNRFACEHSQFDLVGFSLGGMAAAYLANRFPVRRLVLVNAAVIYVSPVRFIIDSPKHAGFDCTSHSAVYIDRHIQAPSHIYTYEQSNHQLCLGPEKDLAIAHIVEFLERREGS